jgi:AraC-like DNA-binding protein
MDRIPRKAMNDHDPHDPFSSLTLLKSTIRAAANLDSRIDRRTRNREYVRQLELILEASPHIPVSLSTLANILDLERTYCSKAFQEIAGESFSSWIRRIRIAHAVTLLRSGAHTVTYVAHAVGYADITTLERNFRKETGSCPRSFQGTGVPADTLRQQLLARGDNPVRPRAAARAEM